ncbi:MAG TPA: nicotinate-nucleotide--dimethylbenzimidazole phosphoribosyltransferase, partial [Vicinamibacterales bacterium]|nr:nicotinate-nucleotide--dimethylbenzimidazole phosphoribosyltransferase [Vicinamibacterales bacterium]
MTAGSTSAVAQLSARIAPVDAAWTTRAQARLASLTKPPGSLGRLEDIAARLCAIQQTTTPRATPRRIVVFAADHGVAEEGVSAYPVPVTAQMVANFLNGGAAINALASGVGATLMIVDTGVAGRIPDTRAESALLSRRVRAGTRNMTVGPAMTNEEVDAAMGIGAAVASQAAADGVAVFACGEMGIGNTTAASAVTAALLGLEPATVTGPGTGVDATALARKVAVIERALSVNGPSSDPLEILRVVGGLEIAAIVGAYLSAAAHRLAVVGDGFIATSAALVAAAIQPAFLDYWFAGHLSPEPGHAIQLRHLKQEPLLSLQMRLGEGT